MKALIFTLCAVVALNCEPALADVWQPAAGHTQIPIWPGPPPDAKPLPGPESVVGVKHLVGGRPWAAGLDVFEREPIGADHPLASLPNATIVPHLGSATVRTRTAMATLAARNLVAALTGGNPPNPVNRPA